jgi:hypothetical protein
MINYLKKRKNFNRIKKLIQTNPVRFEGTFAHDTQKNINLYYVQDIIIRFTCSLYHRDMFGKEYAVFERLPIYHFFQYGWNVDFSENKQIDLDEEQIKILLELAETKYQKPYWIK